MLTTWVFNCRWVVMSTMPVRLLLVMLAAL